MRERHSAARDGYERDADVWRQAFIAEHGVIQPPGPLELAQALFCDNSNVTGIVDRLEERGLVRREAAEGDRRVKLLVLTKEGERMRVEITKRMAEPPPPIASLSEKDQRQLRDILKRAAENISDEAAAEALAGKTPAQGDPP